MVFIVFTAAQISQLARIAHDSLPNESCALLLGSTVTSELVVLEIMPMRNASKSPYLFSIEGTDLLKAYDQAEKRGLQVIGIFHSHPAKPLPSGTDKEFMELNPVVWVIYSTTEHKFKAFVSDNGVVEVELRVKE
ncbi:MAG: M67 family metallopeptidase [Nitrososphaera sp.]|nr:M67 family metallopeptidase [Nitrososphaera sp.]